MLIVRPIIDSRIFKIAPGFRAISISVQGAPLVSPDIATRYLEAACKKTLEGGPAWANEHLNSWAEVFKKFGAKPQRTPCSAEALRKRVMRDGQLPSIEPIVDLYNAISLQYAIPVGGENIAKYIGVPHLTVAEGTEEFDTIKDGRPAIESPEKGEVIWRDDKGVTCRRWNWRQGVRSRLGSEASQMWFILESLPTMPIEALHEAGSTLSNGLKFMMPDTLVEQHFIV